MQGAVVIYKIKTNFDQCGFLRKSQQIRANISPHQGITAFKTSGGLNSTHKGAH